MLTLPIHTIFTWTKYPKKILFNRENNITARNVQATAEQMMDSDFVQADVSGHREKYDLFF